MNHSELPNLLGCLGNTKAEAEILDSTFQYPEDTDEATKDVLTTLSRFATLFSGKQLNTKISVKEYKRFWLHCREQISSSYSGLHFDQYKACACSDFSASINAKCVELCFKKGIPLKRWSIGLTVMIENTPGVTLVDKLRDILLMEADFNFGNRLLFSNKMVNDIESKGTIPSDSFARSGMCANDIPACRSLFSDIVRQRKHNASLGSYDAQSCYDQIVHSFTSMVAQSVGFTQPTIDCMLIEIHKMRYHLRTAHGDSCTCYDSGGKIFQGLYQGNGAAPSLWLLIGSFLLQYLKIKVAQ